MNLGIGSNVVNEILIEVATSCLKGGLDGVDTAKEVLKTLAVFENGFDSNATQTALTALSIPFEKLQLIERISSQIQMKQSDSAHQKCCDCSQTEKS